MEYVQRFSDAELSLHLEAIGAVLITGPKWCGKTCSGEHFAKSIIKLQDPDKRASYLQTAQSKPSLLLQGENPRLIDEWQDVPELWDCVRTQVDERQETGLFILTGSLSVDTTKILHTGTGRISRLAMHTMSLFETGESNGKISITSLFNDPNYDIDGIKSDLSIEELIFAACRGGWPATLKKKSDNAKLFEAKNYFETLCTEDIKKLTGKAHNEDWVRAILRSYARNLSTLAKTSNIYQDVLQNTGSINIDTLNDYIKSLKNLFVVEDIDAWCPAIRSATVIRSGKKRGLCDPSVAVSAMGVKPEFFYTDLKTFGFIFECLCIRDLKVYSQHLGGRISYYHDRYGLEADVVLHLDDGRYALIEIKLGAKMIEEAASHLLKLKSLIQEHNKTETQTPIREPDLLIVLTATDIAYTRPDGVKVVPIGCLRK